MNRTIFCAAKLHPLNARGEGGNALLVENGRISALADVSLLRSLAPEARVVDFGNAVITPGLTDSHIHLTEWAVARAQLDLSTANSIDDVAAMIRGRAPANGWVLGRGWNPHRWGGAYPDATALDRVAPQVPVVLQSHDMHALWLNAVALERAGITDSTNDPDGGRILRDDDGQPTGVLLENAAQLVVPHLPRYDLAAMLPLLIAAQQELHSYGITGVHSFPGVHLLEPNPLAALQLMRERAQLQLRVLQHIPLDRLDDAIAIGLRSGFGDEWIRLGGVKMFLDGALGSRTAWMRAPYEHSDDRGVEVLCETDFRNAVKRAADHGIASVVHAIGDAAVSRALTVLTASMNTVRLALPHRVEHVQCLPADCAPLLSSDVVCSVQPSHLMTDWRAADEHWGAERANATYAFRFMLDNGAILACGSDAPVEAADPRHGLYAAVNRTDLQDEPHDGWHAEQRISAREALAAYTTGPAFAAGIASVNAGLAPGALADFVAWSTDPLAITPPGLLELQPVATVVAGQIVYES